LINWLAVFFLAGELPGFAGQLKNRAGQSNFAFAGHFSRELMRKCPLDA
jgi:hypothetical protein